MNPRPPLPPFTEETARQKVQTAEDAWNSRDPERVALAYTEDTAWRNRSEFLNGRVQVVEFLRRKWNKELDYRLKKELWAFRDNRIAVRFEYEWHDDSGQWYRAYGNENWEIRRTWLHEVPLREHQRPADQGRGAKISLGTQSLKFAGFPTPEKFIFPVSFPGVTSTYICGARPQFWF